MDCRHIMDSNALTTLEARVFNGLTVEGTMCVELRDIDSENV